MAAHDYEPFRAYGLEERKKAHSRLAEIDEERYRVLTGQGEEANGKVDGVGSNEI